MRRRFSVIGGTFALLAKAFLVGLLATGDDSAPGRAADPARPVAKPAPAALAAEVRAELENSYYREVDETVLARRTVRGMLAALEDPYTEYLSPTEYGQLESSASGRYTGVGLAVNPSREGLLVTTAFEGPAREAGIRRGDVIVSIDGQPATQMRFERSLYLIQGEVGTTVQLTVKRPRRGELRFTLVRQELPSPSSLVRMLGRGGSPVGYVRINSFTEHTSADLRSATRRLVDRGAEGIVIDLRDNPGGLLLEAVRSVSLFVEKGVVCTTEGAHQEKRVFWVSEATPFPRLPVVVLVNRGSASASEIVAAGFAENGRGLVVGQRTYGKAAVQSLRELANGAALKLTTATYRTPRGHDLLGKGVRPRVRALDDPATEADEALRVARRSLLKPS